jgi:phospholipase/lecithinase/hemolysin
MQIHPTPRGHAVAAEAILDFLQRRELLGAPPPG